MVKKIMIAAAIMLALSGCAAAESGDAVQEEQASYSAKEIADTILAAFDESDLPSMKNYIGGEPEDSEYYLDPSYAGILISGNYETVPEMEYVEDFVFYTPIGHRVFEIDVLKAASSEHVEAVTAMLQERLRRKDDGDIRLYAPLEVPLIENMRIITAGNYVILLATTDNDLAQSAVSGIFAGTITAAEAAETEPPEETAVVVRNSGEIKEIESSVAVDINKLSIPVKQDLPPEQMTAIPEITIRKFSRNTMYLVGGRCEEGAVIRAIGGTYDIISKSDYGDYLIEIPINEGAPSVVTLTAQVEGKAESDPVTFVLTPQKGIRIFEDHGIHGTIVGLDYQSFFNDGVPDYEGTNLLTDDEVLALQERTEKKISDLNELGANPEIIYMLIPNPMNLYPELVPEGFERYTENSLTKQFTNAVTAAGATVLDLTDVMTENRYGEFKTYHKTDSHWTEYGALLGYVELMNHIAQKFPAAAPRPMTDFTVYNKQMLLGDILYMLEIPDDCLFETTTFVEFNFEPPTGHKNVYVGNNIALDHNVAGKAQQTESNISADLPTAYIYRDSFGGPFYSFITDRFSTAEWREWGQYDFRTADIASKNPDYIIYVITERNIRNIMYQ